MKSDNLVNQSGELMFVIADEDHSYSMPGPGASGDAHDANDHCK